MALASNKTEYLMQNLQDAGCSSDQVRICMELSKDGRQGEMLELLGQHRKDILNKIHLHQKALDSLDYLMFRTEKAQGRFQK